MPADVDPMLAHSLDKLAIPVKDVAPAWNDVLERARFHRRRPLTFSIAATLAIVVAAPAIAAFHSQIARLWNGPPPPAAQKLAAHFPSRLGAHGARGLRELTSTAGVPVVLFVAHGPKATCLGFAEAANQGVTAPVPAMMTCRASVRLHQTLNPLLNQLDPLDQADIRIGSQGVRLIAGRVPAGVTSIEFRGAAGQTEPVTIGNGYFFGQTPSWRPTVQLVLLNAHGKQIAALTRDTALPPKPARPRTAP